MATIHYEREKNGERLHVDTSPAHGERVFLHADAPSFHYCEMFTPEQARELAIGLLKAADRAAMNARESAEVIEADFEVTPEPPAAVPL